MMRLLAFFLAILGIAAGLHWLADRPGSIVIQWQDYIAETSVFRAFVILLLVLGALLMLSALLRWLWSSPALFAHLMHRRRTQRGLDALSSGMIAIGAGDGALAIRHARQARKLLPNAPLTHLLRAQTAQLTGDLATARRIYEAMLASPDTEQLGLRGLFLEAQRVGETEAARQFAERALALNARLGWPVEALFALQCRAHDWQGALATLAIGRRQGLIESAAANRRRAVLLTAQAQQAEDTDPEAALQAALDAHRLAPELVPAATIAGRILASHGNTPRAARVLLRTWRRAPHPDLAATYAYARPGDSPRDRLNRVRHLCRLTPNDSEGPIALAVTAIEAREWDEARKALEPLQGGRLTQRVCTLMARIEGEQHGDTGRVREWLARALNAPRDPVWTADGVLADRWAAVSPVTGVLDAFRWRVPADRPEGGLLAAKMDELIAPETAKETAAARPEPTSGAVPVGAVGTLAAQTQVRSDGGAAKPVGLTPTAIAPPPAAVHPPSPPASDGGHSLSAASGLAPGGLPSLPHGGGERPDAPGRPPAPPRHRGGEERQPARPRPAEPRILVPPRPPDDPGPDAGSDELAIGGLGTSAAKA
jgi:HemY protein